jgi:hypothetical protein
MVKRGFSKRLLGSPQNYGGLKAWVKKTLLGIVGVGTVGMISYSSVPNFKALVNDVVDGEFRLGNYLPQKPEKIRPTKEMLKIDDLELLDSLFALMKKPTLSRDLEDIPYLIDELAYKIGGKDPKYEYFYKRFISAFSLFESEVMMNETEYKRVYNTPIQLNPYGYSRDISFGPYNVLYNSFIDDISIQNDDDTCRIRVSLSQFTTNDHLAFISQNGYGFDSPTIRYPTTDSVNGYIRLDQDMLSKMEIEVDKDSLNLDAAFDSDRHKEEFLKKLSGHRLHRDYYYKLDKKNNEISIYYEISLPTGEVIQKSKPIKSLKIELESILANDNKYLDLGPFINPLLFGLKQAAFSDHETEISLYEGLEASREYLQEKQQKDKNAMRKRQQEADLEEDQNKFKLKFKQFID